MNTPLTPQAPQPPALSRRAFTHQALGAVATGVLGLGGLAALRPAQAAASDAPLRIVVPFGAGGTSDFLARTLAPALAEELRRPVVVENKPGVNGVVGLNTVAKSAPDGNTLVLSDVGGLASTPWMVPNLPLKIFEELTPVALVAQLPFIFVVHPQLQVRNLDELRKYSASRPGGFNFATAGPGSAQHLVGIEMARLLDSRWTFVPYKGGAPALVDIMGGSADGIVLSTPPLLPLLQSGKIRALAFSGLARWDRMPELPTFDEQGLKGYTPGGAQCLLAPSGLPPERVRELNASVHKVLALPAVQARFLEQGALSRPHTPAQTAAFLKAEYERAGRIIKDNNIVA